MTMPLDRPAEIAREYGPFQDAPHVHGVSFDGRYVWLALGDRLQALDPHSGELARALELPAHAGTAFDGRHLFQLADGKIQKIDPRTGAVLAVIPGPGPDAAGLTWAEGTLWVGRYRERKIQQIDPATGAILRTIESNRYVTGVTWVEGELWHGSAEAEPNELRRIEPSTGQVLTRLRMPAGAFVSGLESDGADLFYCGGGPTGKLRAVRRPKK